eukprot:TRINITY_DN38406_c0_g1_i1.p1 TRINITY_DN38406_c0_g1~~TRINITY_DN38406_c0_g1_i1.p1  ORF type:complete len:663 (+),score=249.94 TRINITY_DN38406_c0_g1_i1:96-2084(+)
MWVARTVVQRGGGAAVGGSLRTAASSSGKASAEAAASSSAASSATSAAAPKAGGGGGGGQVVVGLAVVGAAAGGAYAYSKGLLPVGPSSAPAPAPGAVPGSKSAVDVAPAAAVVSKVAKEAKEAEAAARAKAEGAKKAEAAAAALKAEAEAETAAKAAAAAAQAKEEEAAKLRAVAEIEAEITAVEAAKKEEEARTAERARQEQEALAARLEQERLVEIQRREDALSALKDALAAKDTSAIAEALKVARGTLGGPCAETQLAESVIQPSEQLREALSAEALEALSLPAALNLKPGQSEAEAVAAEQALCESLSGEALRQRVEELARYLAASRLYARPRLEAVIASQLEAADLASLSLLEEAMQRLAAERDAEDSKALAELEGKLKTRHEEQVAQAIADATAEMEARLAEEKNRLARAAEEVILEERSKRVSDIAAMNVGLANVEEALSKDEQMVRRVQAQNNLAAALLRVENAMLASRSAKIEFDKLVALAAAVDPLSAQVLEALPASSKELCRRSAIVPTEAMLRQRLADEVRELVATAFVPADSGLIGQMFGRVFRQLYVVEGGIDAPREKAADSDLEHNLEVLRKVAASTGVLRSRSSSEAALPKLSAALEEMDRSLVGSCRRRVSGCIEEMRDVVLLRQALAAVKARLQCLTAAQLAE